MTVESDGYSSKYTSCLQEEQQKDIETFTETICLIQDSTFTIDNLRRAEGGQKTFRSKLASTLFWSAQERNVQVT